MRLLAKMWPTSLHLENAIYMVSDILRNRRTDDEAHRNPLRKLYTAKQDDSDKLNLEKEETEE